MIDLEASWGAIQLLSSSPDAWIWVIPGMVIGLVFGSMPGISITMAMAVFLPATMYMDFLPAIIFLTAIYGGAGFGSAIPSILMNIPGAPSAVATTFDGYPMTRAGRHNEAMGVALAASVFSVLLSYVVLFLIISPLADIVLGIGPLEMLVIALWGILLLGSLAGKYMTRGILAGVFGMLLGTVGMNTAGYIRGTMEVPWLLDGIPVVPAMMGLLAASQLFNLVNAGFLVESDTNRGINARKIFHGLRLAFKHPMVILRGAAIGVFIGAIPGVGASISNLISYAYAKRADEDPDSFGKGNPKGVVAAESANSSSEGGAMATMLALGIPGGGATAIMLAAFAMHNIVGGPSFIAHNQEIVYAIIFSNFAQAILLLGVGLGFIFIASHVVRVPLRFLVPTVLVVACFGSFAVDGSIAGPITLFVFSVIGWFMSRHGYPVAAVVVGLLLGGLIETQLLRSSQVSGGDLTYLFDRPAAMVIIAVIVASMSLTAWTKHRRKRRAMQAANGA